MKQKHSKAIATIAGYGTAARVLQTAGKPFQEALAALGMMHNANKRRKKSLRRQMFDRRLNAAMGDKASVAKTIYTLPTAEIREMDALIADISRSDATDDDRLKSATQIAAIMRNATARRMRSAG